MASTPLDGLYYEFHIPLGLKNIIEQVIATQPSGRNTAALNNSASSTKEWYSQPRSGTDSTTEVITSFFKQPLGVSEIGFDILKVPCRAEMWYLDRQNNWRQMLDKQRTPLTLAIPYSSITSWYTYSAPVYPVVAQAIQIRITRVRDVQVGTNPYVVGLRNTLFRRNVYDRSAGKLPFEEEQDRLGNVINKYIEDWDASQAIDNNPYTFWRSAPQPDPRAVVNLYLDTRSPDGTGQYMDGLFIDPVYSNQKLNVYYSNDDTDTGSTRLSPITLKPAEALEGEPVNDLNTDWRSGRGRWDTSTFPSGTSRYHIDALWGPLVNTAAWIGVEWIPDFDAASAPANNPVLFEAIPSTPTGGQFTPVVFYDCDSGKIALEFSDGSSTRTYEVALSPVLAKDKPLRFVVGWAYDPDTVYIKVTDRQGNQIALLDNTVSDLPAAVSFDGKVGFSNFRGMVTAHIVKREHFDIGAAAFLANPLVYVDPDPVIPEVNGNIPSTTLDNALYAVDWSLQPHGTGGAHESFYTGKVWKPIWRDYMTRRGKLFFPQAISARYLKLEFTNLTEESYPVYDSGIQVTYQVFPVSVTQTQIVSHPGLLGVAAGLLTVGAQVLVGDLGTVNWLSPESVNRAINSTFGPVNGPTIIQTSPGYVTNAVPGTAQSPLSDSTRIEASSPYVYRRTDLTATALAASEVHSTTATTWSQTLSNAGELIGGAIADSFVPLQNFIANPTGAPVQGDDWWVFPGGLLQMPAVVMNGLTALTQTVLGRPPTTEIRNRFDTESVHKYETRTITRDAAIAYFAGVREVQPLITKFIAAQDQPIYNFTNYTEAQDWTLNNHRRIRSGNFTPPSGEEEVGPLTTLGRVYSILDGDFDLGIDNWSVQSGNWSHDTTIANGRGYKGTAKAVASGVTTELWSSPIISYPAPNLVEGQEIVVKVYIKWADLEVTGNNPAVQVGLVTFNGTEMVDDSIVLTEASYADWSAHSDSNYSLFTGTWTVPSGVTDAQIRLIVTEEVSAGSVWFDSLTIRSGDDTAASITQTFTTQSDFAKLRCQFIDSGAVPSDNMWNYLQTYGEWQSYDLADSSDNFPGGKKGVTPSQAPALNDDGSDYVFPYASQQDYVMQQMELIRGQGGIATPSQYRLAVETGRNNIPLDRLAYYTSFIYLDENVKGKWSDMVATWVDEEITWGSPHGLVSINIDPNRSYKGRRVVHFTRESGAGECGVRVRQWTNFLPNSLFRICARWYKPRQNTNSITVRLVRVSDGVIVAEQEVTDPPVGYWHEFATDFQRVPDSDDQVYHLELVTNGDSEDELYLADVWCEISHIRYFIQLGSNPPLDVTDLRDSDTAIVSCSEPVTEFTVEARVYSPLASVSGCKIQPVYLK